MSLDTGTGTVRVPTRLPSYNNRRQIYRSCSLHKIGCQRGRETAHIGVNGDNVTTSAAGLSVEIHDHDDYTSNESGAVTAAPNIANKGATMAI